jgi:RNA polymerase sigma-70 factor (ECF subfamily)
MQEEPDFLSAIAALAQRERVALAALARSEGLGPEDAVDCVHDGLCTFLQRALRGELPAAESEWAPLLAQIVKNAARNGRRRHFRAKRHDALEEEVAVGDGVAADDALAEAEAHVRLRHCVDELCDTQRSVVTLRMLEERPGEDVARELGITPEHVATLLYRAKHALRVCMVAPRRTAIAAQR